MTNVMEFINLVWLKIFINFIDVSLLVDNQIQTFSTMGCSPTMEEKNLGCEPVDEPCNTFVLLQLSTTNRATQCHCDFDGCNDPSKKFKSVIGGYFVMTIGTFGIFGNLLAFCVLFSLKKKNDVDIILTGKYLVLSCSFMNQPKYHVMMTLLTVCF